MLGSTELARYLGRLIFILIIGTSAAVCLHYVPEELMDLVTAGTVFWESAPDKYVDVEWCWCWPSGKELLVCVVTLQPELG